MSSMTDSIAEEAQLQEQALLPESAQKMSDEWKQDSLYRHNMRLVQMGLTDRPILHRTWRTVKKLDQDYYLQNLLHPGSSGAVILGTSSKTPHEQVILKIYLNTKNNILDASAEIDALAAIQKILGGSAHPHVVEMVDYFYWYPETMDDIPDPLRTKYEPATRYYVMVMRKAEGTDFLNFINLHWEEHTAPPNPRLVRDIFKTVLRAFVFIHALGFAHRDVKPENIVINDYDYSCVLIDFGFSCHLLLDHDKDDKLSCRHRVTIGTPLYAAPETIFGKPFNETRSRTQQWMASDIWSLGMTFIHLVTGSRPYPSAITFKEFENVLKAYREPYPVLYPQDDLVNDMLRSMIQRKWQNRPTAMDLLQALENGMRFDPMPVSEKVLQMQNDPKYQNGLLPFLEL